MNIAREPWTRVLALGQSRPTVDRLRRLERRDNRVGPDGRGESVWLGWFLFATPHFAGLAEARGDKNARRGMEIASQRASGGARTRSVGRRLVSARVVRRRRAFGLGGQRRMPDRLSIAQSWAVISRRGEARSRRRVLWLQSNASSYCRRKDWRSCSRPHSTAPRSIPAIKGYPPGVRENGGQYTHAALWSVIAFAELGDGDKAAALFWILNPINHTRTRTDVHRYKVEPYVVEADVYAAPSHAGRGGWTWYNRVGLLDAARGRRRILGLRIRGHLLEPRSMHSKGLAAVRAHGAIRLGPLRDRGGRDPDRVTRGVAAAQLDGLTILERPLRAPLKDDGATHKLRLRLGPGPAGA